MYQYRGANKTTNDRQFPDSCNDNNVVAFVIMLMLLNQFTAFNWLLTAEMAFNRVTHDWSEVLALQYCRDEKL
ncbi:uncharacterized protein Bfra_010631 [Botrytis fragariae]|uniref:Uncharacterized protein n=1 Tax=Botrytis fragariae TaxID=1964551 RepID=A0A8H6AGY7_9HELO|nr:uncharacterized protein Bfra_010631 [Botrytis fragariae]KAF5867656.1 hypothetical protein Bfra_010631 [Botrytis fragariae]